MDTFTVSMVTNTEVLSTEATSVDQSDENATSALYRAAIGPIGGSYYLPVFDRFEEAGKAGLSWNWAAGLMTLNWLVFRQLWGAALAYAGALMIVVLMVFGIGRLLFQLPQEAEVALLVVFGLLGFVLPGFYGNALLHVNCRKKMAQALRTTATLPEACAVLTIAASTRRHLIGILVVNLVLMGAIGGAALAYRSAMSPATRLPPVEAARIASVKPVTNLIAPVMPAASAPAEAHFLINVGLFANDANAQRAHARLQAAQLNAYTEVLDTANGKRTRVRVGPFETESAAQTAALKIKALKLDAVVFQQ